MANVPDDQIPARSEPLSLTAESDPRSDFRGLVGRSGPLLKLYELIDLVGPQDMTVLIQGPTGSGKELVARAIHAGSARARGPYVPFNCSAFSRELAESQLFGHVKGAFTGADHASPGLFGAADGGTLVLDELGEMPLALQPKLLRAVEYGETYPVGSTQAVRRDVRVIGSTHVKLAEAASSGTFRPDLLYRVSEFTLEVPSLAERPEDVVRLSRWFLAQLGGDSGRLSLSPEAERALERRAYPGNVRELRSVIKRGFMLRRGASIVTLEHLGLETRADAEPPPPPAEGQPDDMICIRDRTYESLTQEIKQRKVDSCGGNKAEAARQLNINRWSLKDIKPSRALGKPTPLGKPARDPLGKPTPRRRRPCG